MDEREQQNLKNLELGGVPVAAEERLRAQTARAKPFFVSNLSVNELGLVKLAGYRPLGQVMGCSVYHIGWQFSPLFGLGALYADSCELEVVTQAHLKARDLALSRLLWEARLLGAHGVVGVRFDRKSYEWGSDLLDFNVIGTAIHIEGEPPTETPFTSDLSGEELYQLWQAGYRPVGFAYGNCYWYEIATWASQATQGTIFGVNQELVDFTKGVKRARDVAVQRMEDECLQMGAIGLVGMQIEREIKLVARSGNDQIKDLKIHMQVTGTAIARRQHTIESPEHRFAVSLSDLPLRAAVTG